MLPRNPYYNPSVANKDVKLAGVQYERNPGAEYGEHIKNTGAICNTSASHTYGNVLSIIEKYILQDVFNDPDMFKTITASTTLASRQLNHLPHQLRKKEAPIMVLSPRILFGQDDNRFLANTLINSRYNNTHSTWGDGSLLQLGFDREKQMYVNGHYNRAVMYVDVVLSFDTYIEQLNCMHYLHNMVPIGHPMAITTPLELYIPRNFCELIGHVAKIPVKDKNDSVYDFMTFMNRMFYYPITYKLKGGSNSDEFFMYYVTDIDTIFQEPQAGPGVKDGQIKRNYDVSFPVRCEFNTIGYFTLDAPDMKKQVFMEDPSGDKIIPIFSDEINLKDFDLPVGWSILGWPIFKLGFNENTISLASIMNQSLRAVIKYHLQVGMPMDNFIKIQFRENGQILNNELYYINWNDYTLHLLKPNPHRTYRLIISVSHEYINNLIKELYGLE